MANYNTFSDNGLTALFNHMKATRALADSNESAIGGLGEDLAALAEATVAGLAEKQDTLTFDNTPTAGSTNPVTSGGVAECMTQVVGDIDTVLANLLDGTTVAEVNEILDEINGEVA